MNGVSLTDMAGQFGAEGKVDPFKYANGTIEEIAQAVYEAASGNGASSYLLPHSRFSTHFAWFSQRLRVLLRARLVVRWRRRRRP